MKFSSRNGLLWLSRKEAEEAKKRAAADVMAKVQRSQWCPPPASNTSILDIQRSEREQVSCISFGFRSGRSAI